jgi:GT2 family glycosyltransferase
MAALSIVIPTLGRSEALPHVLSALARQQPDPGDVEIVLVVDADGVLPNPESLSGASGTIGVNVLRSERWGASAARNTGWRASRAPLTLFLDDDIVPCAGLISEHLKWHDANPQQEVGVLGRVRWSPAVQVTPFMRWLEMGIQFDYPSIRGIEIGWQQFYSCNVSVKRAMLERVGGFDEHVFPFGYEDLDLGRRMSEHGFTLVYNKAALGDHLKSETLDGWRRNLRRIATAERRFVERYPDFAPYFYNRFRAAADAPVARGRGARLAKLVPPGVPWIGSRVWRSYDTVCSQQLAPEFLAEWAASDAGSGAGGEKADQADTGQGACVNR